MKCKRCGYKARTIAGLAAHYRKKHPGVMKKRSKRGGKTTKRTIGKAYELVVDADSGQKKRIYNFLKGYFGD